MGTFSQLIFLLASCSIATCLQCIWTLPSFIVGLKVKYASIEAKGNRLTASAEHRSRSWTLSSHSRKTFPQLPAPTHQRTNGHDLSGHTFPIRGLCGRACSAAGCWMPAACSRSQRLVGTPPPPGSCRRQSAAAVAGTRPVGTLSSSAWSALRHAARSSASGTQRARLAQRILGSARGSWQDHRRRHVVEVCACSAGRQRIGYVLKLIGSGSVCCVCWVGKGGTFWEALIRAWSVSVSSLQNVIFWIFAFLATALILFLSQCHVDCLILRTF